MHPTWPSPQPSAPTPWKASGYGLTRFRNSPEPSDEAGGRSLTMSFLTVRHLTVYRYAEPVRLGEHRMMFRPRESHDLRLLRSSLEITPHPARLRWLHDAFDNSV